MGSRGVALWNLVSILDHFLTPAFLETYIKCKTGSLTCIQGIRHTKLEIVIFHRCYDAGLVFDLDFKDWLWRIS